MKKVGCKIVYTLWSELSKNQEQKQLCFLLKHVCLEKVWKKSYWKSWLIENGETFGNFLFSTLCFQNFCDWFGITPIVIPFKQSNLIIAIIRHPFAPQYLKRAIPHSVSDVGHWKKERRKKGIQVKYWIHLSFIF